MTPTLIITRPAHIAQKTANAFRTAIDRPFDVILSPLIAIESCDPPPFDPDPDHVIFTSANAVAQVDRIGLTRRAMAWCVGARTAQAARHAGFTAYSVDGTGEDLLKHLADQNLRGRILHVHGRNLHVDFAQALGPDCAGICVYDQISRPPSDAALAALAGAGPVIVPLYSPNTARIFLQTGAITAPVTLIAISRQTAEQIRRDGPQYRCTIAETPDQTGMITATRETLTALQQDSSP